MQPGETENLQPGEIENLQPGEQAVWERLVKGNSTIGGSYTVVIKDAQDVTASDTRDTVLVVISSLVKSKPPDEERLDAAIVEETRVEPLDVAIVKKLGDELLDVPIPIIASSYELYTALRMCGPKVGIAANQREIEDYLR